MKNWRLMMMGIGIGALLPALAASVLPLASAQPGGGPPTGTAPQQQSLPVVRVVLFSSGVGYFQRMGEVTGDARIDLSFPRLGRGQGRGGDGPPLPRHEHQRPAQEHDP
ncbi:MAG TPA: hypothetical protein PKC45_08100 [Gemmatales bacterium]|nr:hypothetical protein [Gemmatales bacterium]